MYKGIELSASLMCIDWLKVGEQLDQLEQLQIDYLHFDVIDGVFVPDFTMGTSIIETVREHCKLRGDFHFIAEEPAKIINSFKIVPGDFFTLHQESSRNLHRDLVHLRKQGAKVGVALAPGTSLKSLEYILEDVDMVNILTVNPGYQGQKLIRQSLRKISDLRKIIDSLKLDIKISVDGSVNPDSIPEMIQAGADRLVLGSSGLFRKNMSLANALQEVKNSIDAGVGERKFAIG